MGYCRRIGSLNVLNPVVKGATEKRLETYFVERFPIAEVWKTPTKVACRFDDWHAERSREIARAIESYVKKENGRVPEAVGAKFLDTFMYQLMKRNYGNSLTTLTGSVLGDSGLIPVSN